MSKFPKYDVGSLLGVCPVTKLTDRTIWAHLVTPQVRALLGPIASVQGPTLVETQQGLFPGDTASNINNHLLYGGKTGFVRYPYLETLYLTAYGALLVKRDFVKAEITGWVGDVSKGRGQLIYEVALRDRRHDGTLRANDTALLAAGWPFSDPKLHQRLPGGSSVEASIYGFMPGSLIASATGNPEFQEFVRNPYKFLDRPELFLQYFRMAWKTERGPGQIGAPIPDVAKVIDSGVSHVARSLGYDFVEATTSHYNVAMFVLAFGYRFNFVEQAQAFGALHAGVKTLTEKFKLNRTQQTWATVIQSLPADKLPEDLKPLHLGGPNWPWDNICQDYLWLNKPLNDAAKAALPGPVARNLS